MKSIPEDDEIQQFSLQIDKPMDIGHFAKLY